MAGSYFTQNPIIVTDGLPADTLARLESVLIFTSAAVACSDATHFEKGNWGCGIVLECCSGAVRYLIEQEKEIEKEKSEGRWGSV